MKKTPKPSSLIEQVEKTSTSDSLDPAWQDHYDEAVRSLQAISPLTPFNLLDPESARAAQEVFTARLEELKKIAKQIRGVQILVEQKQAESILPSSLETADPKRKTFPN
jgi:hypothetical protein